MLKDIIRGEYITDISYALEYMFDANSGFSFPCDENGKLIPPIKGQPINPAALENLEWCRQHPEKFVRAGEVVVRRREWKEPDRGTCICGETVTLENQYYGACQCPKCGRWYNLFGQSLLPPEQWHMDPGEEEYY